MAISISHKRQKNLPALPQQLSQETTSFWKYETPEDRIARNLWVSFVIGLATFSCLGFLLV